MMTKGVKSRLKERTEKFSFSIFTIFSLKGGKCTKERRFTVRKLLYVCYYENKD